MYLVAHLCLILCDPMDCSPPGSSVHEILQAKILEPTWEDPLQEEMATHFSILARVIPWTEEPGRSMGSQRMGLN